MLERLTDDPAAFVRRAYTQVPHSVPGGCRDLVDRGTWDVLAAILDRGPDEVMVARQGERWPGEGPVDGARGRALFADGWTVAVFNAQEHDEGLAGIAAGFEADLGGPVNVHVYATPAGGHGFTWHYDAEEVFVLQTQGRKELGLRKNTVNPWPLEETLPKSMDVGRERSPVQMTCELHAGDWLYVPAGWWHVARALEDSVSIAVGVMAPSGLDVLDRLREALRDVVGWRRRLPVVGGPGGLDEEAAEATYRTMFEQLGRDVAERLADPSFVRRFLESGTGTVESSRP
jgi:ribosomal protein L16 Arg81 hydroxylase